MNTGQLIKEFCSTPTEWHKLADGFLRGIALGGRFPHQRETEYLYVAYAYTIGEILKIMFFCWVALNIF